MISQEFYFKIIRTFELVKENLSFILSKKKNLRSLNYMKEIKNKKVYNENETHDKNMCIFILLKQYLHS